MSSRSKEAAAPQTHASQPVLLTRPKNRSRVAVAARSMPAPSARPLPNRQTGERRPGAVAHRQPAAHPRLYPRWPNLVHVTLDGEHNFFCGFFREVESTGLFVATYTAAPLGEVMLVSFTVAGHEGASSAVCEVRWVREHSDRTTDVAPGVGFGFVRVDAAALAAVSRFMELREPIFWEG